MKYIDAELLRKEVEERMHTCNSIFERNSDTYFQGRAVAYKEALSIIDSLRQEQQEVDLENYLKNYFKGWYIEEDMGLTKPDGWSCIVNDLKDIARHFYELGKNSK